MKRSPWGRWVVEKLTNGVVVGARRTPSKALAHRIGSRWQAVGNGNGYRIRRFKRDRYSVRPLWSYSFAAVGSPYVATWSRMWRASA